MTNEPNIRLVSESLRPRLKIRNAYARWRQSTMFGVNALTDGQRPDRQVGGGLAWSASERSNLFLLYKRSLSSTNGALTLKSAPRCFASVRAALTTPGLVPSATRHPTTRPSIVGFAFAMMLSAAEFLRSLRTDCVVATVSAPAFAGNHRAGSYTWGSVAH